MKATQHNPATMSKEQRDEKARVKDRRHMTKLEMRNLRASILRAYLRSRQPP